ncbi:MAG: acyl--CoA ligase [Alphaproteobacteria bacterium]|nr:acyl--CoA ligase [Alphaproteobacteria bacterium]
MTGLTGPRALIPEIIQLNARWLKQKPALVFNDTTLSWTDFGKAISSSAGHFQSLGAQPGDRVTVIMQNSPDMPVALFGAAQAGLVTAPLNLTVSDEALIRMIMDAGARFVIATVDQCDRIDALRSKLTCVEHFLCSQPDRPGWTQFAPCQLDYAFEPVEIDANQAFNIIYSSGTTGQPKGILHTHQTRLDWSYALALALRYHNGAKTLCTLGLYSNISWVMMLCTWLNGGTLVLHPGFDAEKTLSAIASDRITHTAMVPVQFQRLVDHPACDKSSLASLQAVMSCGSALPAELKDQLFKLMPCGVIELYGLTEGVITTLAPEDAPGRLASVGKPMPGTDLLLLGEDGNACRTGEAGEILARGSIVMPGYFNRPDANIDASWAAEDGSTWLRTGDIGKLDDEGFLYIVDRKKDMIISGGQNIYPADLEAVLLGHPAIKDAAVIGLPDPVWGETPAAVIADPEASLPAPNVLLDWANDRLGRRQKLRNLFLLPELPRNPNGKVLKRELRAMFEQQG